MENIKILVPLDFSDLGSMALHAAEKLAQLFNGSITPFHAHLPVSDVDNDPYMMGNVGTAQFEDYDEIEERLHNMLKETASEEISSSRLAEPQISIGNPAQAIVEEAKNYDFIVMTTHGRTGFSRFFLGSVTEKVLRTSHVPVLIVNKERELTNLDKILLTTDFSDHSKKVFRFAAEIAQKASAEIELLHIISYDSRHNDPPEESKVEMRKQRLKVIEKETLHNFKGKISLRVIVSSDTPHEAILNYNLNQNHDLIVMSTVGRTGIDYLMMGSTTANVVRHVKSPVLSFNPKMQDD